MLTRMKIIIIMMLVTGLLFKYQPCSHTALASTSVTYWPFFSEDDTQNIFRVFSIPSDPFQELNMFQHSPPHQPLVGFFFLKLILKILFEYFLPLSDPFQELNIFQHSPPHRSLAGPLPCRAMVTHQYHRVDQALNRIMMIILHFRILNLRIFHPFLLCPNLSLSLNWTGIESLTLT